MARSLMVRTRNEMVKEQRPIITINLEGKVCFSISSSSFHFFILRPPSLLQPQQSETILACGKF
uniref:Uncharacterized protein n=1 Tax=Salix viminalis TaxID=40686 RepID=A0A6N2MZ59_SALVM